MIQRLLTWIRPAPSEPPDVDSGHLMSEKRQENERLRAEVKRRARTFGATEDEDEDDAS